MRWGLQRLEPAAPRLALAQKPRLVAVTESIPSLILNVEGTGHLGKVLSESLTPARGRASSSPPRTFSTTLWKPVLCLCISYRLTLLLYVISIHDLDWIRYLTDFKWKETLKHLLIQSPELRSNLTGSFLLQKRFCQFLWGYSLNLMIVSNTLLKINAITFEKKWMVVFLYPASLSNWLREPAWPYSHSIGEGRSKQAETFFPASGNLHESGHTWVWPLCH